jgi:hypothetical protein
MIIPYITIHYSIDATAGIRNRGENEPGAPSWKFSMPPKSCVAGNQGSQAKLWPSWQQKKEIIADKAHIEEYTAKQNFTYN